MGRRQERVALGEPRLVQPVRRTRRRRTRVVPAAAQGEAVPRVPSRGPGHQLVRPESGGMAPADAGPPQAPGRLHREDGPARRHPALELRRHQGRHPGPGRQAPARRGGLRHRAPRLRGVRQAAPHGLAAGRGRRRRLRRRPAPLRLPGAAGQPLAGRRPQGLQPAVAPQHQEGREGRLSRSSRAATRTCRPGSTCTRSRPSATSSARARSATSSASGRPSTPRTPTGCACTSRSTRGSRWPPPRCSPSASTSGTRTAPPPTTSARSGPRTRCSGACCATRTRSAAGVYDLRGISDTLDENDHLFGLIQFKVGTGGEAVEYVGEWDFPLNKMLHKALDIYMSRR